MSTNALRALRIGFVAATLIATAACFAHGLSEDGIPHAAVFATTPADAERIVLVLYKGQSPRRLPSGARMSMYRQRGHYKSNSYDRKVAANIAKHHHLEYLTDWRISEIDMHCAVYRIPGDQSLDSTIHELDADTRITTVQRMTTFRTMSHTYSDPYFDMQVSAKHFNLAKAHTMATGRNVSIAMIDTGVSMDHPDLEGQIDAKQNFVEIISPGFQTDAHGTAVAGVIAAKPDNGVGIVGIAPDSHLTALKACWPKGEREFEARCNSFTLALAFNTALRMGAKVINLSLTGPPDTILERLIREASRRNVIVVAAVPPDVADAGGFPASMPEVIAVQSRDLLNTLGTASELGRSVSAPGHEILTTVPNGRYDFLSGSSLAAAQISGYIALIKQIYTEITTDELRNHLQLGPDAMDLEKVAASVRTSRVAAALPPSN